jgi:hypothetical protein
MTKFEDNLLHDLMSTHGSALASVERAPAPRSARPLLVAAGALVVAGVATVGVATWGGSPDAYAVTKNPDGTVTVSIRDVKAVDAANAKLQELGVRAKAVPMTDDCADLDEAAMFKGDFGLPVIGDDGSVTMGTDDVPVGYTVLLGVSGRPDRGTGLGFTGPVRNPAPSCLREAG